MEWFVKDFCFAILSPYDSFSIEDDGRIFALYMIEEKNYEQVAGIIVFFYVKNACHRISAEIKNTKIFSLDEIVKELSYKK